MADLWSQSLAPIVAQFGIVLVKPPLASVVAIVLTLLPALIVMLRSPKVSSHRHSVLGSLVFAVLGVMLTYSAFTNAVVLDEASAPIVKQIFAYDKIITTAALVIAVVEALFRRGPSEHGKKKHA